MALGAWIDPFAYIRHEAQPINQLAAAVFFLLPNTVGDDMRLAENPELGGFPRVLPNACLATRSAFSTRLSNSTDIIDFSASFWQ